MQENLEFAREGISSFIPFLMGASILAEIQEVKKLQSEANKTLAYHTERFDKIDNSLAKIYEIMGRLQEDFSSIKNESRKTTEVLMRLSIKLDKLEDSISEDEFDEFYALAEQIYLCWEDLDQLTKKFIPLSEFLFSNLQKCKNPDYSPVIIELCRAFENEFLTKIFAKFTKNIIKKYPGEKLSKFLYQGLKNKEIEQKVKVFANAIMRASKSKSGKMQLTLGQMNTIVSLMKEPCTVAQSQLLKEFDGYLGKETLKEKLLKKSYTDQISEIIKDYRNPSAHSEYMTLDKAKRCKEFMPDRMEYLMECVRVAN